MACSRCDFTQDNCIVFAGLPAKEIHVCGHECAIELVKRIAETAGDTVEASASQDSPVVEKV